MSGERYRLTRASSLFMLHIKVSLFNMLTYFVWLLLFPSYKEINMGPTPKMFISNLHLFLYPHSQRGGYIAITLSVRQSVCPFVHPFTLSLKMSQLLLEEMIVFLIHGFGIVTCTVSPLSRLTSHLLPVYRATQNFSCLP